MLNLHTYRMRAHASGPVMGAAVATSNRCPNGCASSLPVVGAAAVASAGGVAVAMGEELALEPPFAVHVVGLPAGVVLWVPVAVPVAPMLGQDSRIMRCHRLLWMRLAP